VTCEEQQREANNTVVADVYVVGTAYSHGMAIASPLTSCTKLGLLGHTAGSDMQS
jgi:hypothetical protein